MRCRSELCRATALFAAMAMALMLATEASGGSSPLSSPLLGPPGTKGVAATPTGVGSAKGMSVPFPYQTLYRYDGDADTVLFGFSIAGGGDVNNDGVPDFMIGAPYESPGNITMAGSAYVYSGLDGSQIFKIDGTQPSQWVGSSVAIVGDLTGDGHAEFLVGAMGASPGGQVNAGSVYLYSGQNGSLLQQKDGLAPDDQLGTSVAAAGLVNGDAIPDYIIGAPYADSGSLSGAGAIYVYSGLGGGLLYRQYGAEAGDNFGQSVASVGDINIDGRADFIVSAPYADSGKGVGYVFSGLDGDTLFRVTGDSASAHLGWGTGGVNGAGDVNGDGWLDFIVGAPHGNGNTGAAYVYSGLDGSLHFRIDGNTAETYMGFAVAGADVDGDGISEVIISAPGTDPNGVMPLAGAVYIYSIPDGRRLHESFGASGLGIYGYKVAGLGDLNGDGRDDFMTSAPQANAGGHQIAGSAHVLAWGATDHITSLADVGNDQGGQVRIQWSHRPVIDAFTQEFAIYRRVDGGLSAKGFDPYDLKSTPPGVWDYVTSVPARGDSVYSVLVPTLRDSTIADGMWWSVFFVSALGESPLDHFDSPVDSGYSLDNLAPGPPANLIAAFSGPDVDLDWKSSAAVDFDYYRVYRDTMPGFALDPNKVIGETSDTSFVDSNAPAAATVYYRVSAVDFSGNEGTPSNEASPSSCPCNCAADPACDGVTDVFDVTHAVNVAFRNAAPIGDSNPLCPYTTTDVDCSGVTDIFDVTHLVNVAFRNANAAVEFCDPCP